MAKISNFGMHTAYLLGFAKIADVRGISSVVSLFENRMILSGIYLQIRPDRHVYIGKTSNIIRRFERHLQNGVVMEELAFMPMHLRFLDKKKKTSSLRQSAMELRWIISYWWKHLGALRKVSRLDF